MTFVLGMRRMPRPKRMPSATFPHAAFDPARLTLREQRFDHRGDIDRFELRAAQLRVEPREDEASIALEDRVALALAERQRVD